MSGDQAAVREPPPRSLPSPGPHPPSLPGAPGFDETYRWLVDGLPARLRQPAERLPWTLGLTQSPDGRWSDFVHLHPNRQLPLYAAQGPDGELGLTAILDDNSRRVRRRPHRRWPPEPSRARRGDRAGYLRRADLRDEARPAAGACTTGARCPASRSEIDEDEPGPRARPDAVRRLRGRARAHGRTRFATAGSTPMTSAVSSDDGRLRVTGRADDVIISGGVNVPSPAAVAPSAISRERLRARCRGGRRRPTPSGGSES